MAISGVNPYAGQQAIETQRASAEAAKQRLQPTEGQQLAENGVGNNLSVGSEIIPDSAFKDADTVTVTPENIGRLGGDVLLTPQQTKELYEKGSLQVRREFQTAESNEGFMTLTAKLAAAFIGPSRSVAAIQIDPLFLEMIKDPNAKVGMGYTRVSKETWTVMPSPEAQTTTPAKQNPPDVISPMPPPIESATETTKKFRELQDEKPVVKPAGNITVYGDALNNYWAGTASGMGNFSNNQLGSTQDGTEMEVRGYGYKTGKKADPSVQRLIFTGNYNKFTGDMARHNRFDTAKNINGMLSLTHNWSEGRIDTQHTTKTGGGSKFQFSGNDSYHFLVDQGKGIPLSGAMQEDYLKIAGADAKNPGTVFDLYVANNKNITLGSPPSEAEGATVAGTYTENQTKMQELYKDLYATAFPDSPAKDMDSIAKNASMEDFYLLVVATQHNQKGGDLNTLLERDADGNVSLKNTPESREKLGNLLNIPQNKRTDASEIVASFSMLMESNFAANAGTTLLSTQNDDDKIMALHHDDLKAHGHTEEEIKGMARTTDDASEVNNIESKENQLESASGNSSNITKGSSNRATWALNNQTMLAGTQAGVPPQDLSGVTEKIAALPAGDEKSALVSAHQGVKDLSKLIFKPGSLTEPKPHDVSYPRGEINRLITSTREQINNLPEGSPERTGLETELNRIKDIDNALRGQFVMVVKGSPAPIDTPPINSEPRIEEYYSLDEVIGDTETDTSKMKEMINRAGAEPKYVVHPTTVDLFKTELKNKLTIIDEILASENPNITDPALTPEKREKLEGLKATLTGQLEQLNDKNSAISKSAENGGGLVRAHELGLSNGSIHETGSEAAFAGLNTEVEKIKTYLDNAMSTDGLDSKEKEAVGDRIHSAYENAISHLKANGLNVSDAIGVSKITEEDLKSNGNFSPQAIKEVLNLSETLKNTQSKAGLISEGVAAQKASNSISDIGNRLDNFDVQTHKKAFVGELKNLAEIGNGEVFNSFISETYNLEPRNEKNAAQYDTLRKSAIEGTLPFPPTVQVVDASEINGADGAYINADGKPESGQIKISKDILNDKVRLNEVFAEEMFHHLEKMTEIGSIGDKDPSSNNRGSKFEALGDEGRAAVEALRSIQKGQSSAQDIADAADKGRNQASTAHSGGNITMEGNGSDRGTITTASGAKASIEFNTRTPEELANNPQGVAPAKEEVQDPGVGRYAAVDMDVTPRNAHPTREVDMTGVDAELFNAVAPLEMDKTTADRLNEHPATEEGKKFSIGDVITGLPNVLLGAAKTFEAYAERLQELVQKHFLGQNGVANNLSNVSNLMSQAQSLNGYHNTNPDLKLTELSPNYSRRPVYDNQNAKDINANSEQYHKQQMDRIAQNNAAQEARNSGHNAVVG